MADELQVCGVREDNIINLRAARKCCLRVSACCLLVVTVNAYTFNLNTTFFTVKTLNEFIVAAYILVNMHSKFPYIK